MSIAKGSPLFGKVNVYDPEGGTKKVEIYIRLEQRLEEMRAGIAIDGSASMMKNFAAHLPPMFRKGQNMMEPVVRQLCGYIAPFTGDGTVLPIYWALGTGGMDIELIGSVTAASSETMPVNGPVQKVWGTGTKLVPALDYYLSEFREAKWTVLLFITDGMIEDLDAIKALALRAGKEIVAGTRKNCKFIVVGIGEANAEQMDELDNMFDGTPEGDEHGIDLWDCKMANEMNELAEVWDEVDFGLTIPGAARILDEGGKEIKGFADGIPQRMEFEVPASATSIVVELAGERIVQLLQ